MSEDRDKIDKLETELIRYNVGKTPFLTFAQEELITKDAQTLYYNKLFDF